MAYLILVVEDVEEIRDGIIKLLKADGYRVAAAREPEEVLLRIGQELPDLMLVGLGMPINVVIQTLKALRTQAGLDPERPVVIFDFEALEEGQELAIEGNIYKTRPDNFNQLRALIRRLLN
jgi:CheY-like chemotaxis protein